MSGKDKKQSNIKFDLLRYETWTKIAGIFVHFAQIWVVLKFNIFYNLRGFRAARSLSLSLYFILFHGLDLQELMSDIVEILFHLLC